MNTQINLKIIVALTENTKNNLNSWMVIGNQIQNFLFWDLIFSFKKIINIVARFTVLKLGFNHHLTTFYADFCFDQPGVTPLRMINPI